MLLSSNLWELWDFENWKKPWICERGETATLGSLMLQGTGNFAIPEQGCGNLDEHKYEALCFT